MEKREEAEAWERYDLILNIVNKYGGKKKEVFGRLIQELVAKCAEYIKTVRTMVSFTQIERFRLEPEEYQAGLTERDSRRRAAHNALIAQLHIVNRNLLAEKALKAKIPVGGIYSLDPRTMEDRRAIGTWAGYLIGALARRGIVSP